MMPTPVTDTGRFWLRWASDFAASMPDVVGADTVTTYDIGYRKACEQIAFALRAKIEDSIATEKAEEEKALDEDMKWALERLERKAK